MKAPTSLIRSRFGLYGWFVGMTRAVTAVVLTVSVDVPLVVVLDRATGLVLNEQVGGSLKFDGVTAHANVTGSAAVMLVPVTVSRDVPI